jgi:hypothetical protein
LSQSGHSVVTQHFPLLIVAEGGLQTVACASSRSKHPAEADIQSLTWCQSTPIDIDDGEMSFATAETRGWTFVE